MMRDPGFGAGAWVLIVLLAGCTRWESFQLPTAPEPKPGMPSYLRVSAPPRDPTVLVQPFVRGDTLYGRSRGDTLGIALPAIERLERPRLDGLRTAATVVGSMAAWITVGLLAGGLE
jgi:hypothetical protein